MARKALGPTGSRRRRWLFLCTTTAAIAAAVLFIPSAFAVHATGIFQLDSDATQSLNLDSNAGQTSASEDWSNVCAAHLQSPNIDNSPGEFCHPTGSVALGSPTVADKSAFVTDACCSASSDNIYKGGTDDGPITPGDSGIPSGTAWQWKDAVPSPDKADIEQAFAAEYLCDGAHGCTNNVYSGDNILYFGGTRQAKNGDTNIGFWFMRNNVTLCGSGGGVNGSCAPGQPTPTCSNNNGCAFSGTHHAGNVSLGGSLGEGCNPNPDPANNVCDPGDLFIQSAFTSKPTITIYEWVGYHKANPCITSNCDLNKVTFPANPATGDNKCTTDATDSDFGCAITNGTSVASPWFFTDKTSGAPANTFGTGSNGGELFEGGIDLSKLGFGGECISTFVLNTRSSGSSVNSTDQDLAIGHMGGCTSSLKTTAGDNASGLSIGTGSVTSSTDSATVTVSGIANWSGTVDFYLCGPIATGVCTNGGVKANGTAGNVGVAVDQGTTTVSSGTANLTSAGRYCWFAHFSSNTSGVPNADEDGSADTPVTGTTDPNPECFTVSAVKPKLTTSASCSAAPCVLGSTLNDSATLTGTASNPDPANPGPNGTYPTINGGTKPADSSISWTLYGPNATGGAQCTTTITGAPTPSSKTVSGDNTYGPVSYATSLASDRAGKYEFAASYGGDGPNTLGADAVTCDTTGGNGEQVTVVQHPTSTVTGPVDSNGDPLTTAIKGVTNVFDKAVVTDTDAGGPAPTGTVSFWICNPTQVIANGGTCSDKTGTPLSGNDRTLIVDTGTSHSHATSSPAVVPDEVGVWCFRATYNPDTSGFIGSSDNSVDECFNVVDVTIGTAQTFTVKDSATITPSGPGASVGGDVRFRLYPNGDCSGATTLVDQDVTVPSGTSAQTVSTTPVTITTSKPTLSWLVEYTHGAGATAKNVTSACATENASLTINNGP